MCRITMLESLRIIVIVKCEHCILYIFIYLVKLLNYLNILFIQYTVRFD